MKVTDDSLASKLPSWESKRVKTSGRPSGCCGLDAFHHRVQAKRNSVTYGTIGHKVLVVFYQTLILWMRKRLLKSCTEGFACTRENKQTRLLAAHSNYHMGFFGGFRSWKASDSKVHSISAWHRFGTALDRPPMSKSVSKWFLPIKYLQQQIRKLKYYPFKSPLYRLYQNFLASWPRWIFLSKQFHATNLHNCNFPCKFSAKEPHTPYPLGSTKPSKSVPCTPLICNSCRLADNTMSKGRRIPTWVEPSSGNLKNIGGTAESSKISSNSEVSQLMNMTTSLGGHIAGSQQGRHRRAATGGRLAGKLMQLWTTWVCVTWCLCFLDVESGCPSHILKSQDHRRILTWGTGTDTNWHSWFVFQATQRHEFLMISVAKSSAIGTLLERWFQLRWSLYPHRATTFGEKLTRSRGLRLEGIT